MSFSLGIQSDVQEIQSGERFGSHHTILTATTYEDGLKVGRFAKMDTGSLDNMDGSATPVIAGVVLRKLGGAIEDASTISTDNEHRAEYMYSGLVAVDAKAGETPTFGDVVYASNAGDANDGLATVTNTDVVTSCNYIRTIGTNLWLVYVNPESGLLGDHIQDTTDAHDASAISVADAGTFTTATQVEAALQEMLPATSQIAAIADPGDAGAIPVLRSGMCALTTAGAETRTIAVPATVGIKLAVICDTYVGDAVVTVASTVNQTGNNTLTFGAAADMIVLESMTVGGSIVWRVTANDGVALTTV